MLFSDVFILELQVLGFHVGFVPENRAQPGSGCPLENGREWTTIYVHMVTATGKDSMHHEPRLQVMMRFRLRVQTE